MNKPHKHAAMIKAWAEGAKVQVQTYDGKWNDITGTPRWQGDAYRVKPEEPKLIKVELELTEAELVVLGRKLNKRGSDSCLTPFQLVDTAEKLENKGINYVKADSDLWYKFESLLEQHCNVH